ERGGSRGTIPCRAALRRPARAGHRGGLGDRGGGGPRPARRGRRSAARRAGRRPRGGGRRRARRRPRARRRARRARRGRRPAHHPGPAGRARQRGGHRVDDERARDAAGGVGGRLRGQRARHVPVLQARHPRDDASRGRLHRQRRVRRGPRGPAQPGRLLRLQGSGDRPDQGHRRRPRRRRDPRQRRLSGDGRHPVGQAAGRGRRRVARRPPRAPADGAVGPARRDRRGGALPRLGRGRVRDRDELRHRRRAYGGV
ncbi:MAG: 3-oxoacyl-[acyl-carrier protein] reductase, partial [uncultured Solirubrobacteraceae bacterium]